MNQVNITISIPDLKNQLSFLIRKEFELSYSKYLKVLYCFLGITIGILALMFLTNPDSLVTLKVMSIVVLVPIWTLGFTLLLIILIELYERFSWRRSVIKTKESSTPFLFSFDNEALSFVTEDFRSDIKWGYYKYYAENKNSIFMFPEKSLYEAIFYSKTELGQENYEALCSIAASKLIALDKKNGT